MIISSTARQSQTANGLSLRTILPGFIVALMFMLASTLAAVSSKREGLLLQIENELRPYGERHAISTGMLRTSHDVPTSMMSSSVDSIDVAIDRAIARLQRPSADPSLESVTLKISLSSFGSKIAQTNPLHAAIPDFLMRQLQPLNLYLTLRVAPQNLPLAIAIVESLQSTSACFLNRIAIGVDTNVTQDVIQIDVCRFNERTVEEEPAQP